VIDRADEILQLLCTPLPVHSGHRTPSADSLLMLPTVVREAYPGPLTWPRSTPSGRPAYAMFAQQPLNTGHADLEVLSQLTPGCSLPVAQDEVLYVRLAQPITDPPDTGCLLVTDTTQPAGLINTPTRSRLAALTRLNSILGDYDDL
jgi:hypothetical protein